jgi:hypothetical protein
VVQLHYGWKTGDLLIGVSKKHHLIIVSLMFYVYESVGVNNLLLFKQFTLQEAGMAASKIIRYHVPSIITRGVIWAGHVAHVERKTSAR